MAAWFCQRDALAGDYWLEDDGTRHRAMTDQPQKPLYRVPAMAEVAAVEPCGLTVASMFAGCGGSSLGYRMAGYRVLWANEFVPAAQASYAANKAPWTVLDGRDIKKVDPAEALAAMRIKKGELDVLDGSPPCQAFSTAGKRHKGWGEEKTYEGGGRQRNEDMFSEYVRLLRGLAPRAFVAENVSGLVKGVAKGYFLETLAELKASGYRVEARLLDAQWLGVPQTRSRIIFVGVRDDLGLDPVFPSPLSYRYSVREAIPWLVSARSGPSGFGAGSLSADLPAPTIPASQQAPYGAHEVIARIEVDQATSGFRGDGPAIKRRSIDEPMAAIMAQGAGGHTPGDWSVVTSRVIHDAGRAGREPRDVTDEPCPTITAGPGDAADGGEPRNHFMVEPESDISRYAIGREADKLGPGDTSHRYFQLQRAHPDQPSPAILASSGEYRSTASVIHPTERRKFTIAELKRICAFPDDFVLTGSYAQQWERLGNSVPPLMMRAIAEAVRDRVLLPARARSAARPARSRKKREPPPGHPGQRLA